jgi:hypothetical protein
LLLSGGAALPPIDDGMVDLESSDVE